MGAKTIALICVAALVVPCVAQTIRPVGGESSAYPYEGMVTGTNVLVRSGPNLTAYPCAKLSRPAKVTVVATMADSGYLKILAPAGCYGAVHKNYVEVNAATMTGTILRPATGEMVYARAASADQKRFGIILTKLSPGDKVKILRLADPYYVIHPPKTSHFYISARYVRKVGPAAPTTAPATGPAPTTTTSTAPTIVIDEKEIKAHADFSAADKLLVVEYKKPPEQRDYAGLLAKYTAIEAPAGSYIERLIAARIKGLKAALDQVRELKAAEEIMREVEKNRLEYERQRTEREVRVTATQPIVSYNAKGVLAVSQLFFGGLAAPKRFLVRDKDTQRINAYVQSTTGLVDLRKYVDKHVGVIGQVTYDKRLALDVVEVETVVVLAEEVELLGPPRPRIIPRPIPKPATRPAPKPAPAIRPVPAPKPAVKPALTPKPVPEPEPATKPAPVPRTAPEPTPTTGPAPETKPAPQPEPETRPAPEPEPEPEPEPQTKPSAEGPLPPTGLPVVEPSPTTEPVDEEEYD